MSTTDRAQAASVLRAVADLIEHNETVPVPKGKVSFSVYGSTGEAGPGIVRDILAGLPGGWKAREIPDSSGTYFDITRETGGVEIQIWTTAGIVAAEQGTRTIEVPAYEIAPGIAALLDEKQEGQA